MQLSSDSSNPKYPDRDYNPQQVTIESCEHGRNLIENRAESHRLQGDYPQAIADYTELLALNPRSIDAYFQRGITYAELGDLDRALADYDRIIELDIHHVKAYIQRSWIYFRQGEYRRAVQECELVKSIDQVCFCANYLLGIINSLSGLKYKALANFTKSIEINPNYVSARYHRGLVYYDLGNRAQAIADFTQARSIQDRGVEKLIDRDETGFYAEGVALYYSGQIESATTMLKLALLAANRFNNPNFHEQVSLFLNRHYLM
jgi:tetratricopeptide (TPR) repeat protein